MNKHMSIPIRILFYVILALLVPGMLILLTMPIYYEKVLSSETALILEKLQKMVVRSIDSHLFDQNRLSISPLFNKDFKNALLEKSVDSFADVNAYERKLINSTINDVLYNHLLLSNDEIVTVALYTVDNELAVLNRNGEMSYTVDNPEDLWWVQKAVESGREPLYMGSHFPEYHNRGSDPVFSVIRSVYTERGRLLGVMKTDTEVSVFDGILEGSVSQIETILIILHNEGDIVFSSQSEEELTILDDEVLYFGNRKFNYIKDTTDAGGWSVLILRNSRDILRNRIVIFLSVLIYSLIQIGGTILLFISMSSSLSKSFRQLKHIMAEYGAGKFKARYVSEKRNELNLIGSSLNRMGQKIEDLIDQEYKTKTALREAQFMALQNQVQPHFLYNIFNSLLGLNRLNDKVGMESAIISMRDLLNYTVHSDEYTTISQEFAFLENYCALYSLLLEDRFSYGINIEDPVGDRPIPRLLIQPLVENAVVHGIENSLEGGQLIIAAELKDDTIHITVEDNGSGFDASETNVRGIGLENVRERLLLFRDTSELIISSNVGKGTVIKLIMADE